MNITFYKTCISSCRYEGKPTILPTLGFCTKRTCSQNLLHIWETLKATNRPEPETRTRNIDVTVRVTV